MGTTLRPEDILTPDELATRLKVPKSWVYEKTRSRSRNRNPLPCLRLGRYIRFDWARVVEWLIQEDGDNRLRERKTSE
jgi:excisionase family DNA binding protein